MVIVSGAGAFPGDFSWNDGPNKPKINRKSYVQMFYLTNQLGTYETSAHIRQRHSHPLQLVLRIPDLEYQVRREAK